MKKNDNPALREAAKEFNDSLLDAQKKKIDELLKVIKSRNNDIEKLAKERNTLQFECDSMREASKLDNNKFVRMGKEISRLNGIIHKKNVELDKKRKGCIKVFNENQELRQKLANIVVNNVNAQALKSAESALAYKEKVIKDKDAVLSDVAEECRLSKIREEKLTEACKKYLKEIEDLKEKETRLVGIINKNDKVIGNMNHELCKVYKKYASLNKEYDELEKCKNQAYKSCAEKNEKIKTLENGSKEYCDYGVAANNFIMKLARAYITDKKDKELDIVCKTILTNGKFIPENIRKKWIECNGTFTKVSVNKVKPQPLIVCNPNIDFMEIIKMF